MTTLATQAPRPTTVAARAVQPAEVEAHLIARDATILDVRTRDEVAAQGWIPGAVHVPADDLDRHADPSGPEHRAELDPHRLTIVVDGGGGVDGGRDGIIRTGDDGVDRGVDDDVEAAATRAANTLARLGYRDIAQLRGGVAGWERAGYPVAGRAHWHPRLPST